MKKVLVTGGAGFFGRRLTRRLIQAGFEVTVVDNLSSGIEPSQWPVIMGLPPVDLAGLEFLHADVRDFFKEVPADNFDTVFHCAAVVGGRLKIDGDPLAVATDLAIDSDFFQWCVKATKKPKVIYFSSSAVYPIETQRLGHHCVLSERLLDFASYGVGMPDMTYGWSKLTGEVLVHHAVKSYGLDAIIYRPFSGYGEDQALDYPFPSIVKRVVDGANPVVVWGSGNQTRDFIYIEDAIDAVFATMHKLSPGEALNLGTGVSTSFMNLAEETCNALKISAHITNDPRKPEGVFARVADIKKLSQWYQATTPLHEGILRVAQHLTSPKMRVV